MKKLVKEEKKTKIIYTNLEKGEGKMRSSNKKSSLYFASALTLMIVFISSVNLFGQSCDTLWLQDWELGWGDWYTDGAWEVGEPTYGPDSAYSPPNCAGTILGGGYPNYSNARLISPSFTVPNENLNPRVGFWHWFGFEDNDSDYGRVQIKVDHPDSAWVTISEIFNNDSKTWTQCMVNLSDYANLSVRICFNFVSDHETNDAGWYVDDVALAIGYCSDIEPNVPEDFESGIGDWYADNGHWQVGVPNNGPDSAYSGENCAGTILNGGYHNYANTRLVSPPFIVPDSQDNPRLRFWHWFAFEDNDSDYGRVQISVNYGDWITLPGLFDDDSRVWTQRMVDLSAYANSSVRIGFYFTSDHATDDAGWYIDDITLVTGPYIFLNPEDFENGIGDWYADNGLWQIGQPSYPGPSSPYSGENCAGTVLNGGYYNYANTRLVSPPFVVPGAEHNPSLSFHQWYKFEDNDSDYGYVQIKVEHPDSSWNTINEEPFSNDSPVWNPYQVPLHEYADLSIRIAFYFTTDHATDDAGWFIDYVCVTADDLGTITGIVFSNDALLIEGVYVSLVNTYICDITDTSGNYCLSLIEPGTYDVFFSHPECLDTVVTDIIVNANDTTILDIEVITGINDDPTTLPSKFTLNQNYPNPFNAATTISYDLPKPSTVTLDIYDILGRKVEKLVNEQQQSGYHQVVWNAEDKTSGMYFYKIQAGDYIETRKMLLLK